MFYQDWRLKSQDQCLCLFIFSQSKRHQRKFKQMFLCVLMCVMFLIMNVSVGGGSVCCWCFGVMLSVFFHNSIIIKTGKIKAQNNGCFFVSLFLLFQSKRNQMVTQKDTQHHNGANVQTADWDILNLD